MKKEVRMVAAVAAISLGLACLAQAARLEVSAGEPVEIYITVGVPTVVTFPEKVQGNSDECRPGSGVDGSRGQPPVHPEPEAGLRGHRVRDRRRATGCTS